MTADYDRAVRAETEREDALGKLDAARVVETTLRNHIRDLDTAIDGLVQVVIEAKVGEHAWDCPANGKMERLASCDCSHPETSPQKLRADLALAAVKALRR